MSVSTSSLNIRVDGPDDFTTDHTQAIQELLNRTTYIIIDTVVNLAGQIQTRFDDQIIEGTETGEIRPIGNNMATQSMIALKHPRSKILNLISTNPLLLKSDAEPRDGGGRQGTVDIQADFCLVQGCTMTNQVNAVIADSTYRAHGSRILGNYFFDCIGVGREDRGDAVSIWGSGTVIDGNYASCKEGTDGRIAFHAEAPVTSNDGRPEFDAQHTIMTNNLAWGSFRRHFAFEGISNGVSIGNISIGGATWWGEAYIMCTNVIAENTIKYTRPSGQAAGASWKPKHGAICIQNWSSHVNIRSVVLMEEGSSGAGVILTRSSTVAGEHKLTLQVSMRNKGDESNNAFDLVPAEDLHLNNCYAEGFANQIKGVTADYNHLLLSGCRLVGNGTASGILIQGGSGGKLFINQSIVDVGTNDYAMSLFELAMVRITGTGFGANKYAVNLRDIKELFIISNCYNLNSAGALSLRYGKTDSSGSSSVATSGDVPEIEWVFSNNEGINSGFVYSLAQLKSLTAKINTVNKSIGKTVIAYDADNKPRYYYSLGTEANSSWVSFDNTETLIPV
ncbi:hypothetical protein ACFSFZ_15055 [Mixta tenebrionis]|mgnify:CR=1 FL=1|uniref:Right-handed parallel beta-helix repeat-containing protein n=1 Tax=Mixta tenebrionis TaxID=2562439 RepID=A0A506VCD7_9GAMM|nr:MULTISPECIES: hypothetical protein [Mixta]QHM75426.1 hypothetical protein C7M52_01380 [Mixta theicola]TPW43315.1 hypothetical protein FKM52_07080 [Mixta tenebrionis]